jgi:hypothetical protein
LPFRCITSHNAQSIPELAAKPVPVTPSDNTNPQRQPFFLRWRRRLRRFRKPRDLVTFAGIGLGLIGVGLPLRLFGVRRTANRLTALGGATCCPPDAVAARLQRAERLALDCDAWLRRLRPINPCLRRSLVLLALLRRQQIPATLVIGIRTDRPPRSDDAALAHAWLELDGEPILERCDPLRNHQPSVRYPAPAPAATTE